VPKFKPGDPKPPTSGRRPGVTNRVTRQVQDMVRQALDQAGGVEYLVRQAEAEPRAFLALVGKVIPRNVVHDVGKSLEQLLGASMARQVNGRPPVTLQRDTRPEELAPAVELGALPPGTRALLPEHAGR
jgi:hypothetical protein